MYRHIRSYEHIYLDMYNHMQIYVYTYKYIDKNIHIYKYSHADIYIYIYIYIYMQTHIYTDSGWFNQKTHFFSFSSSQREAASKFF